MRERLKRNIPKTRSYSARGNWKWKNARIQKNTYDVHRYRNQEMQGKKQKERNWSWEITSSDVRILGRVEGFFRSPMARSLHGYVSGKPFFLPFASFMVLKPVKDILAFNLSVLPQFSWDFLNLISTRRPNSIVVIKILQDSYLFSGGCPPGAALPAHKTAFTTAAIIGWQLVLLLVVVILLLWLWFHDWLKPKKNTKRKQTKQQTREWETDKKRW